MTGGPARALTRDLQGIRKESMGAKLMALKEREKKYKKIVDNPMLYLEECQHQILLEEHPAGDPLHAVLRARSGGSHH